MSSLPSRPTNDRSTPADQELERMEESLVTGPTDLPPDFVDRLSEKVRSLPDD